MCFDNVLQTLAIQSSTAANLADASLHEPAIQYVPRRESLNLIIRRTLISVRRSEYSEMEGQRSGYPDLTFKLRMGHILCGGYLYWIRLWRARQQGLLDPMYPI